MTSGLFRTLGDDGQRWEVDQPDGHNPLWSEPSFHLKCGRANILDTCVQSGVAQVMSLQPTMMRRSPDDAVWRTE